MKKWYIKALILMVCSCTVVACSDMNDLHDKYLQEGEVIYLAKFDSISLHPGRTRVMVEYWYSDPKAAICLVTWDMGEHSKEVSMSMSEGDEPNVFYIDGLNETTISFDFIAYTEDKQYGSLISNSTTTVYGDKYVSTLMNASVTQPEYDMESKTLVFRWASNYENVVGYSITYTTVSGEEKTIRLDVSNDRLVVLSDFPEGGSFAYSTIYKPSELAIDEFMTEYICYTIECE